MGTGTLIAERIRVDAELTGVRLTVRKISRSIVGDESAGQPLTWTLIEFEFSDDDANQLAASLSAALDHQHGWYCDFRTDSLTFVVFAGKVFHYPRGDPARRRDVAAYARSLGVPDPQLDWPT